MGDSVAATLPRWLHADVGDEIRLLTTDREVINGRLLGVDTTHNDETLLLLAHRMYKPERVHYIVPLRNVSCIAVDLDFEEPF